MHVSSEVVKRLVDGIASKLSEDVRSWRDNLRLKVEAELYEAARSVVDAHAKDIEEIEREITLEREHRMYTTMMEIEREKLSYVEQIIDRISSKVREKVMSLKGTDRYRSYIRACILNGLEVVGSKDVIIVCSESDRALVESIARELGLSYRIETVSEELLGVRMYSSDKKVGLDLSLDTRIMLIKDEIRYALARAVRGG